MKIHLVYPGNQIALKEALEENGHEVTQWDYDLNSFLNVAQSDEKISADCAFINGTAGVTQKKEAYEIFKKIRKNQPHLRIILQFSLMDRHDHQFVQKLLSLAIYDLHFVDEFDIDDVEHWLNNPKTFADYDIDSGKIEGEVSRQSTFQSPDNIDDEENYLLNRLKKIRKQKEIRTQYKAFAAKIITVSGMKGGIGKTDIAINLAAAFKEHTNVSRIVVVDYDFPYGGIARALQFQPTQSLGDWILKPGTENLTEQGVQSRVIDYESLHFIPMTFRMQDSIKFQKEQAEFMLDTLRKYYDVIIVDTSGFSEAALIALMHSTEIIFVCTHDYVSISNTIAYKNDLIRQFGVGFEKMSVFLNMIPKTEDISKHQIAEWLEDDEETGIPIIGYAPYDDVLRQMRNKGLFVYREKPTHPFSKGIDMVLQSLEIIPKEAVKKRYQEENPWSERVGKILQKISNR